MSGIAACSSQTGVAIETCGGSDLSWAVNLSSQTVGAIETCGAFDLSCIGLHLAEPLDLDCWFPGLLCYPLKCCRSESYCFRYYLPGSIAYGQALFFYSVSTAVTSGRCKCFFSTALLRILVMFLLTAVPIELFRTQLQDFLPVFLRP